MNVNLKLKFSCWPWETFEADKQWNGMKQVCQWKIDPEAESGNSRLNLIAKNNLSKRLRA